MKDLIILLPGIMGSALEHNGQELWNISGRSIFNFIRSLGGNLQNLVLHGDDPDLDDLDDGITSTALLSDTVIVPGFWKIDGYTKISNTIQTKFSVTKGDVNSEQPANFYEFHYDWRRDNRVAARKLQRLIERQLPIWRNHTGDQSAKVVLIGHSMGGLVARHYLEVEGGWRDCRMLITFGTPYRGSLNILNFLANGYKNILVDFTEIVRSLTSAYQLLPVYKSVSVDGTFERITDVASLPNVDAARAAEARKFHLAIKDAVESNRREPDYLANFRTVPIVGQKQPTLQSGTLGGAAGQSPLVMSEDMPDAQLPKSGDGTVPLTSAIPFELEIAEARPFIEQHGSLQNNSLVLDDLEFLLLHLRTNQALHEAFGPNDQSGISLRIDDLYLADKPVHITADLINAVDFPTKLNARFDNIDASSTHFGSFLPQTGGWVLHRDPLPVGRYRVRVEPDVAGDSGIAPVTGLFEVADLND